MPSTTTSSFKVLAKIQLPTGFGAIMMLLLSAPIAPCTEHTDEELRCSIKTYYSPNQRAQNERYDGTNRTGIRISLSHNPSPSANLCVDLYTILLAQKQTLEKVDTYTPQRPSPVRLGCFNAIFVGLFVLVVIGMAGL
jgi:hypothetical protein